jgi:hypothetical protein
MPDVTAATVFNFEALTAAWGAFAFAAGIPLSYCGDSTAAAHEGTERAPAMLHSRIVATNDYKLFALLHVLGNASLRMEQVLDPVCYAETEAMVDAALADAELTAEQGAVGCQSRRTPRDVAAASRLAAHGAFAKGAAGWGPSAD